MATCCERITGGRIQIVWGDKVFEAVGEWEIDSGGVERTPRATASGRLYVTEEAMAVTASGDMMRFCGDSDPRLLWDEKCDLDVTIVNQSTGVRHQFTNAVIAGRPRQNLMTGTYSGLVISTDARNYAET